MQFRRDPRGVGLWGAGKYHWSPDPGARRPTPLSVVAQSAGQPVLGIQGDHRNRAKLTLVLHVVLCMDRFAKVRENLHQGGLKLGRLLAMGHGTAASNSQTQHCMKRAIAAKKHA